MKLIDLLNESKTVRLNERMKPITKKHWDKADEDQRLDYLLQAFKDISDAEKYVDYKWNNLPATATSNMYESKINEVRLNEGWMDLLTYGPLAVTAALSALSLATDTAIKDMPSKAKDAVSNFNLKSILKSIKAKWRKYTNPTVYEIIQKMVNDPDIVNASKNLIRGPRGGRRPDLNNAAYLKALKAKLSPQEIAILKNFLEKIKSSEVGNTKSFQSIQKYTKGESVNEAGDFAGWIAFYNGKRLEIKKSEANGIYGAKQIAIKKLKVPKSKQGLLAIKPAVEESVNEAMGNVDFKDGLVDYIGDNPKLDKAYNSMKNPKDFMKLLITTMRNDKKAKKLYSYFSKNRTKGALDIIQKLASGDI